MPQEITRLADAMLRDPARVAVTPQATTVEKIAAARDPHRQGRRSRRCWPSCSRASRSNACWCSPAPSTAPTRSCAACRRPGFAAEAIHGNKSQPQRERALAAFRDGKLRTLIATDIAARGIDVDGVSHVINYDLPNIPESYVHRIGRTARAGAEGIAISFCDHEERAVPARHRAADPHGDPGNRPPHRRAPAPPHSNMPETRHGGRPQRGGHQQRGNGGHGAACRPAITASARIMAAMAATKAVPSMAATQPPARKPRRGSQAALEMLHSCSARAQPRSNAQR